MNIRASRVFQFFSLTAIFLLGSSAVLAQGPSDVAGGPGAGGSRAAVEITSMTVTAVTFEFDALPTGATSLAAIKTAFLGTVLNNLTFLTRPGTGIYNFQTGGGRALATNANGSGALAFIDPPAGTYGNADSLTLTFSQTITEFGFEIGDWGGPFNVSLFSGSTNVGDIQVNTFGDRDHFIRGDVPFDSARLTALPHNPQANWVIPTLYIPVKVTTVPTLGEFGLVLLMVLLMVTAYLTLLRRRRA